MALRCLSPEQLWVAEMPMRRLACDFGPRMTVVRLPDGALWIHSPIALTQSLKRDLDQSGIVRHVVSPCRFHHAHVAEFAQAYPAAAIYAAAGSAARLRRLGEVRVLREGPEPAWAGVLDQAPFRGSRLYDEVDFFHAGTRTLILTDLCFNIPTRSGWMTRFVAQRFGILGRLSASRSFGLTLRDRTVVVASLRRILAWDFERVIIAHGEIVEREGRAAFRSAFEGLLAGA